MIDHLNRIYRNLLRSADKQNGNSADSLLRRFQLLCALYDSLSVSIKNADNAKDAVSAFVRFREKIEAKLNEKEKRFSSYDFQPDLLGLEIALIRFLPTEDLIFWLDSYRDEYRNVAGDEIYNAYLNSKGYKQSINAQPSKGVLGDIYIRADANFLLSQILRYQLLREKAELARSFLLGRLWKYSGIFMFIFSLPILVFWADSLFLKWSNNFAFLHIKESISSIGQTIPKELVNDSIFTRTISHFALLGFAACSGIVGAFLSAANRIQSLSGNLELARDTLVFRSSADQLRLSPITGAVSAILLCFIFGGRFIEGGLFPKAASEAYWYSIMLHHEEFAKLLVWTFIAGFSERFVPDLLDRFVSQTKTDKRTDRQVPLPTSTSQIVLDAGLRSRKEENEEEDEDKFSVTK